MFQFRPSFLLLSFTGCLFAAPITGLFNTGVNAGGVILSGNPGDCCNGLTEIHWLQNGGTAFTYTANVDFGPGTYLNSGTASAYPNSMWISTTGTGGDGSIGTVPYTLAFVLGPNLVSASITGRWATDNCGSAQLNGGAAFSTITNCNPGNLNTGPFRNWTPFTVSSGFVNGTNTLSFNLQNSGGLQAIRVEFLESNAVSDVPEPATLGLAGSVLIALGIAHRKRRSHEV